MISFNIDQLLKSARERYAGNTYKNKKNGNYYYVIDCALDVTENTDVVVVIYKPLNSEYKNILYSRVDTEFDEKFISTNLNVEKKEPFDISKLTMENNKQLSLWDDNKYNTYASISSDKIELCDNNGSDC